MDQLQLKLILIALMFVLSVICGLAPLKLLQYLRKRAASATDIDEDRRWPSLLLCLVTCFSGGVFLATCFLHLLPEVTDEMQEIIQEYQWPASYPLAELISCAGFFLVFLIEELVILCLRGQHHHHHGGASHRHHSGSFVHVHVVQTPSSPVSKSGAAPTAKVSIKKDALQKSPPPCFLTGNDEEDERAEMKALTSPDGVPTLPTARVVGRENGISVVSTGVNADLKSPVFPILSPCGDLSPTKDSSLPSYVTANGFSHNHHKYMNGSIPSRVPPHHFHNHHSHDHSHDNHGAGYPSPSLCEGNDVFTFVNGAVQDGTVPVGSGKASPWTRSRHSWQTDDDEDGNCPGIELPLNAEPECCEGPCDGRKEDPPIMMAYRPHAHSHGVRSITLVVALSFHSVIEGLAFGIQDTTASTTALFLGIIIHKCIIVFSTGVQLARTHAHQLLLVVITIVLVSLMSPIGAGIGVAVEQTSSHSLSRDVTIMVFSGLSVGTFLYVTFFEVLIHERDNEHNNLLKLLAILIGFLLMAGIRAMEDKHSHGSGDLQPENATTIAGLDDSTAAFTSTRFV